jgi:MFS family permease
MILLFLLAMILANMGGQMYGPLMSIYIRNLGASVPQIGLFFTLSSIVPLALQILGGWLSDSLGRLQAIAVGSLFGTLVYVVILLAPSWQWLLLAMAASAMCGSFVGPSYQAFIAEQSTEQTRGRVYGLVEGIYAVVGVVGPPIGGYLVERFNFRLMFCVAAALYLMATFIRLVMARGARRAEISSNVVREAPNLKGLWANLTAMTGLILAGGLVTWIMLADGVRDVAFSLTRQLEPLYMQDVGELSTSQIGWLVSIASFTTMVLMMPAGLPRPKRAALAPRLISTRSVL